MDRIRHLLLLLTGLALGLTALGSAPLSAQSGPNDADPLVVVTVTMQARAQLRGLDLRVGDLATIETPLPELTRRIEALPLGRRPARGFERRVTRDEVVRALTAAGLPRERFSVAGARHSLVSAQATDIAGTQFREVADPILQAFLGERRGAGQDVEARLRRTPVNHSAPPGRSAAQLRGRVDVDRVTPTSVTVAVDIVVDGQVFDTVHVVYDLQLFTTAAVTLRAMRRGEPIVADAVADRRIPVAAGASTRYVTSDELVGKVAATSLAGDRPLRAVDLAEPRVVERDDPVRVVCRRGSIQVAVQGTALAPGAIGDAIQVRNLATGRVLAAVVAGPGLCLAGQSAPPLPVEGGKVR